MRPQRPNSHHSRMVIAAAMILSMLAIVEASATHVNALEGNPAAPWSSHVRQVDDALAQKNISAAERAWHRAYLLALGSRGWEGMVEVGDAYLRIGKAANGRKAAEAKARRLYLSALFRARQQGSLDGVLRATEAFDALGDQQVVEQGLRIAERLAEQMGDPRARDRVSAFRERLADRLVAERGP